MYASDSLHGVMLQRAAVAGYETTLVAPAQCDYGDGNMVQQAFLLKRGTADSVMLQSRTDVGPPFNHVIIEAGARKVSMWIGPGLGRMSFPTTPGKPNPSEMFRYTFPPKPRS